MAIETPISQFKLVSIGGGTGHYSYIDGMKRRNNPDLMTAITGVMDSGGSSGKLIALGVLPPGDARQCIMAFAPTEVQQELAHLANFRFPDTYPDLAGHNPINIELAALELIYGSQEQAAKAFQRKHRIPGHVLPVGIARHDLIAKLENGEIVFSETNIDQRYHSDGDRWKVPIDYLDLTPSPAYPNPSAITAITEADAIICTPGDLYTSLLPPLLVNGIPEAIRNSKAVVVYCGNIMTKPGETDFGENGYFKASDYIREMNEYLGGSRIDLVILNQNNLPEKAIAEYAQKDQRPVEADVEECQKLLPDSIIVTGQFASYIRRKTLLRHDDELLASAIIGNLEKLIAQRAA